MQVLSDKEVDIPSIPLTSEKAPAPTLPETNLLSLSTNDNNEIDLSSLMAGHEMETSTEDCVLPTVPSLSDMMPLSEFCGSIDGANCSPEHGEVNGDLKENSESGVVQVKAEVGYYYFVTSVF